MVASVLASDQAITVPQANVRDARDFPDDEFLTINNVPVFAEHRTQTSDGREISFGYNELKVVADRCNRRIAESGDYAAICIGHTPKPEAKAAGVTDPDVVGFAGPFRMGRMGQEGGRQRWAILADFHIFREDVGTFRKHPRRSPELWLEDEYAEMFLDPIALLGAEAPRLDLGLLYSARLHRGGRSIVRERYTAVAPCSTNVFVPSADDDRKNYSTSDSGELPMTDQDVNQICQALGQTEEFQFIRKMMAEQSGGLAGGEVAGDLPSPAPTAPASPQAPPSAPASTEPPTAPAEPPSPPAANGDGGPPASPPAPPEDKEKQQNMRAYSAMDELSDEEVEQYMAARRKRNYEADASSNSAGSYQTANEGELGGSKVERAETSGPAAYQAEGSAGGSPKNPSAEGTADGSMTVAEGSVDDATGNGRNASTPYARNGHLESIHYQRIQADLRRVSDESAELRKGLEKERYARVNAERRSCLQELQMAGFVVDPEEELQRLPAETTTDEQFNAHVSAITHHYQRMPTMDLPYEATAVMGDPTRPGTRQEKEKYSKACSEKARQICESLIESGENTQPSYTAILEEVKNGKHGTMV